MFYNFYFSCFVLFKCKDKKKNCSQLQISLLLQQIKPYFMKVKPPEKNQIQLMLAAVTQQDGGEIL